MKHLKARNLKAEAVVEFFEAEDGGVKALQDDAAPHVPAGCTTIFSRSISSGIRGAMSFFQVSPS